MNTSKTIDKKNIEDILALSPMQEGILFHYIKDTESNEYFVQLCLNIEGHIVREYFIKAWNHVKAINQVLRTVFRWDNLANPVQIVLWDKDIPVKIIDLSAGEHKKQEKDILINRIKENDKAERIDITTAPFRIMLIKIEKDKYEMIISSNHILFDGWSNGIILKEFFEAYQKLTRQEKLEKRIKSSFKNMIKLYKNASKERQKKYWEEYLTDLDIAYMATSESAAMTEDSIIDNYSYVLSYEEAENAYNFCKDRNVTLANILYTAWGLLLLKYNNTADAVFGTTVSGRNVRIEGIENIAGLFINTVPLRIDYSGNDRIIDILRKTADTLIEREEFEITPLVDIKSYSGIKDNSNLFDSIVVVENYPLDSLLQKENGILRLSSYEIYEEAKEEFILQINTYGKIEIKFISNKKFTGKEIKNIAKDYRNILNTIISQPELLAAEVDILEPEEKQKLLYKFNDTYAEYPKDKTIQELFEEQVYKTPDNTAVVYEDKQLTYRELNERSNQLARVLRSKGVAADSIVGIMAERSLEMIVGIMGILKAGGAYLPIDPDYPKDRIEYMLKDSRAGILFTQKHLRDKTAFKGEVIVLDDEQVYAGDRGNLEIVNTSCDTAYVIYTSGSTGRPKGVMVEHKALSNFIGTICDRFDNNFGESDKCLSLTGISFDVSVGEIFLPVTKGCSLVLYSGDRMLDIAELGRTIAGKGITFAYIPPSILKELSKELKNSVGLIKLNKMLVGVEPIKDYVLGEYSGINKDMRIVNGYGPTEATICATMYKYTEGRNAGKNVPIGSPMNNTRIYIVDKVNKLRPVGAAGELCIAGDGLARGYLNRPELTAEKFIPNPFVQGERIYKTGDLARWLPDGNIEFLGRLDNQVKIRGFRIELGEIESRLLSCPEIKEAAVAAKEDRSGNKYLCAYIAPVGELTFSELREYLSRALPNYMIPSYFVKLDRLPLNPNGKVDRKALPEPDGSIMVGAEYELPRNKVEEKLVDIWKEVLSVSKIGINDNFFELGGHSLKAASLVSKIHKELNVKVPLKVIFDVPTVKGLSEHIKGIEENKYSSIERVENKEYYEMSSAQKRMYTLQQLDPAGTGYNMPGIFEVEGDLDAERFKEAFKKLIKRHEALRTSFELTEKELVQKVHEEVELDIQYREAGEEEVKGIAKDFIRAFDLSKAPLLRVGLIKVRPQRHILMYDMHHIISDGVSMEILVEEFTGLYIGNKLPELKIQYKDYAVWHNKHMDTEEMRRKEKYWLKQFEGEIPVLNLPTDYQRPAFQSFEGDSISFAIDKETTEGIRKIAKKTGSTMYMVLLAAFNILLSKYSGQEDIVVGSPVSGRPHADLENIIGMFINTLAMRSYPKGEKTFREFLEEVKENSLRAYENQDYQFEDLVEKLDIQRDMSRNPVFDVIMSLQNKDMGEIKAGSLKLRSCGADNKISRVDLTLTIVEKESNINANIEYCTKLYRKSTIERMAVHFVNILANVAEDVKMSLADIDMLSSEEKRMQLKEYCTIEVNYPKYTSLMQMFEREAEDTPDSEAVIFGNEKLTYRELNKRANRLARILREKGVKDDTIVGIMFERSFEMIIAVYAVLKAGGAYLPIDPEYPGDRIRYMLDNAKVSILLTQQKFEANVLNLDSEIIVVERSLNRCILSGDNLDLPYNPDRLVYAIYTSGSTGKPKCAMVKSHSFVNLTNWYISEFNMKSFDRNLLIAPISFDTTQKNLFSPLITGGALCLYPPGLYDYDLMSDIIKEQQVTVINCTPSAFYPLLEYNRHSGYERLRSLRYVFLGGESINLSKIIPWIDSTNYGAEFINTYGTTECTDIASYYRLDNNTAKTLKEVPIGKPLYNMELFILDKHLNLLPSGLSGELYIGGVGVGRGYFKMPELTSEKFISNPFVQGERIYKTGDLVRWLPDGNLEFIGRIDYQVKVRGFRIELGEIESRLLNYSKIKEAVVAAKEDESGSRYLCAYIVPEGELKFSELREYLSKALPNYMIPSYFVKLDKLPLNPNGKIDRKALPEPDGSITAGAEYEVPRNKVEEKLTDIWKEVLSVSKIGINDNFFELGGHSLKATSLTAKIHKELNVKVPLRVIFDAPTIKGLSEYIKGMEENKYSSIEQVENREYYEMSSAQKRLYTLQQLDPASIGYNMPGMLDVEGELDADRLKEVFNKLIKRHEALRTSFELRENELVQKIHEEAEFDIEHYEAGEEDANGIVKGFVRAFDLSKAPLLRVGLIKVRSGKYILMYDMHHIISDGVSMGILEEEFTGLYTGKKLPELRIQYKDYAAWQNKKMRTEEMSKKEKYWLKQFEGEIPVLNLPADYPRPAFQSFEGDSISFKIDKETTEGIRKVAIETGTTMYMVILAAFNVLLSKYSGQEDIVVGSPVAGRPHADLENIIGMFVNTLAMRNYPEGIKTFRVFLEEVKANALKAFENQDYQFEELVERLEIHRDMSRNPLFDVVFVLQNTETKGLDIEGLSIGRYEGENRVSKFDLTIEAIEKREEIGIRIEYSSRLFNRDTIERMARHLRNIISYAVVNADKKLSEIEIMTETEKNKVLYELNDTYIDYPRDKTIHELFEEQAERMPDNIAVVFGDRQVTYKELNQKANAIARMLVENSVKSGDNVGIMAQRGVEMIASMLGILKAGGAYVPIEPGYPAARQEYIALNSDLKLMLTDKNYHIGYCKEITITEEYIRDYEISNLNLKKDSRDLAYTIYTSGSTGMPKGVMIEHHSVVNLINWVNKKFNVNEKDSLLFITSMCFDLSVYDIFGILASGGKVLIADKEEVRDPQVLLKLMEMHKITFWDSVPSTMNLLVSSIKEKEYKLDSLRVVFLSGDWIPVNLPDRIKEHFQKTQIISLGGATEGTIWSIYYPIEEVQNWWSSIPYGKPIDNNYFYILDKYKNPIPYGAVGELYIGGAGVARGYSNDEIKTKASFMEDKFSNEKGARMYKTGDMGRYMPDGNIEFLGRIDHQVKIRGFRIELSEIESNMLSLEGIEDCTVIAKEDKNNSKYLCVYYIAHEEIPVAKIREHLAGYLPDYMMPSYFVKLDKMPLTSNGKIDRKALPEPDGCITGLEYAAPSNVLEARIQRIWEGILYVKNIGINDNFFDCGGHSLKLVLLLSRINEEFNTEIPLREIFKLPTIKEQSEYIGSLLNSDHLYADYKFSRNSDENDIKEKSDFQLYDASPKMKRSWWYLKRAKSSISRNINRAIRFEGDLDITALRKALDLVVERHEALRTTIVDQDTLKMKINNNKRVDLIVNNDIFGKTEENEIAEYVYKEISIEFDFISDLMIKAWLFRIQEKTNLLAIAVPHLVCDGWSMNVICNDLVTAYKAVLLGDKHVGEFRKTKIAQFKEYTEWINNKVVGDKNSRYRVFWESRLKGKNLKLNLPYDYKFHDNDIDKLASEDLHISFKLNIEQMNSIKNMCNAVSMSKSMLLLAISNLLLVHWCKTTEITVVLHLNGRPADYYSSAGYYVNAVYWRFNTDKSNTLIEYLYNIKDSLIEMIDNQYFSDICLETELGIKRDKNVLLNFLAGDSAWDIDANLKATAISKVIFDVTKFDFMIWSNSVIENTETNTEAEEMYLIYKKDLFTLSSISKLKNNFLFILDYLSNYKNNTVEELLNCEPMQK